MRFAKRLATLPTSLFFLAATFTVLPVLSCITVDWPWVTAATKGPVIAALSAAVYWIMPLALAACIVYRRLAAVPLLFLETTGLIYFLFSSARDLDAGQVVLRAAALFFTITIGLVLFSRDVLTPLLSRGPRGWRKASRLLANALGELRLGDGRAFRIVIEDVSINGIGCAGNAALGAALRELGHDAEATLRIVGAKTHDLPVHIRSCRDVDGMTRIGVEAVEPEALEAVIDGLHAGGDDRRSQLVFSAQRVWMKSAVKRTALVVWALSIGGSFASPACGDLMNQQHASRRGAPPVPATEPPAEAPPPDTTSSDHGFGLLDPGTVLPAPGVALAYTGPSLSYDCGEEGSGSLGEDYSQGALLGLYQGNKNWWNSAMASLEESDARGAHRPNTAIHTELRTRLAAARNPDAAILNLVRFRFGDRPHIKLNYEIVPADANLHPSVASASFIHAVAVPNDEVEAFVEMINAIPQDEREAGCHLKKILDRFTASGSYWFLHTNILDDLRGEWVWTEHLVVENDGQPVTTGCADKNACGDRGPFFSPMGTITRRAVDKLGSTQGADTTLRDLRVFPMTFKARRWNPATETAELRGSGDLHLWWDGSVTTSHFDMVDGPNGERLPSNHLARASEETWLCSNCHMRAVLAGPPWEAPSLQVLDEALPMAFRHVGFGFGVEQTFGHARPDARAELSPYLRDIAFRRTTSNVLAPSSETRHLYQPFGASASEPQCSPWGGCRECADHQDFKWCIWDATWLPRFDHDEEAIQLAFSTLGTDARQHKTACADDASIGQVPPRFCAFLDCVVRSLDAGESLRRTRGPVTWNDPTFSCPMDDHTRP